MAVQALLTPQPGPAGYFHRELLIRTPEGRRVDLITVTDCHGILVSGAVPRPDLISYGSYPHTLLLHTRHAHEEMDSPCMHKAVKYLIIAYHTKSTNRTISTFARHLAWWRNPLVGSIQDEREPQIDSRLFPEQVPPGRRPFEFEGKDVVFVSARVHPGETPASFVFQGILRYSK